MDQRQAVPKKKKKKLRRYYDYSLLFTIIFLTVFGLIMIYSSSSYSAQIDGKPASYYMTRQMYIALAGFAGMIFTALAALVFFREKITRSMSLGIFLCFAGVCCFL